MPVLAKIAVSPIDLARIILAAFASVASSFA
jgi:hypothetical protein